MEIPLLTDILIIFSLSVVVLFLSQYLKIPTVVGFLLTGILAGPHLFGLIEAQHEVEILAEVGVVLLLFTIGIEFSFQHLLRIKRTAIFGGFFQVVSTILITMALTMLWDFPLAKAVFLGFFVSLSSTAIVLKVIQTKGDVDSPYGRNALAILIFQDIIIIPMMLFVPFLAGTNNEWQQSLIILVQGIAIVILVILAAYWLIPKIFYQIAKTRNQELFLLSIFVLCFAIAWLTSSVGLSLALGAFLAGLIISNSEYSYQAMSHILPFRDIFTSFFFISIGMLLDVHFFLSKPFLIIGITILILFIKTITGSLANIILGYPLQVSITIGLGLCQIGEFSLILSKTAIVKENPLLSQDTYQFILAIAILTMILTPFIMELAPVIAKFLSKLPLPDKLIHGWYSYNKKEQSRQKLELHDHLIIVGYGVNGQNIARAARVAEIPYIIIEMNPVTVKKEKAKGESIIYGDASYQEILHQAHCAKARVVAISIPDIVSTRKTIAMIRQHNKEVYIIVRTRFVNELEPLYAMGADEIIPEEFETSVEIFTRVMMKYLVPQDEIEDLVAQVRSDHYDMFRTHAFESSSCANLNFHLPGVNITSLLLKKHSAFIGLSIADSQLKKQYNILILAIRRGNSVITNPKPQIKLLADDILIIMAEHERIQELKQQL